MIYDYFLMPVKEIREAKMETLYYKVITFCLLYETSYTREVGLYSYN